jgi:methylmalonyl-CoA mutase N-terminal domain/subunit
MESLTAQLEAAAEALLHEVEGLGGMTEALLAGECSSSGL